jgi:hypothetical protein
LRDMIARARPVSAPVARTAASASTSDGAEEQLRTVFRCVCGGVGWQGDV